MLTFSEGRCRVQHSDTAVATGSFDFGNKGIHAALPEGRGRERWVHEKALMGRRLLRKRIL